MSGDVTFYAGAASGSCRKALRQLLVRDVMINYATQNNDPWPEIGRLFVDCGGYSFMAGSESGEYETSDTAYLEYVERYAPDIWALRDYPCEPDVLEKHGRTVEDHQRMTLERHIDLLEAAEDRGTPGQPVSVIQGWRLPDYLEHIDALRDHGVLTEYVGIGSVCRRHREEEIREIILRIRDELGPSHDLHAFGVRVDSLQLPGVADALTSADSQAFEFHARYEYDPCTWKEVAFEYLRYERRLAEILDADETTAQSKLPLAVADGGFGFGEEPGGVRE